MTIDWQDIEAARVEITRWADATFPKRTAHGALSKMVLEEIPELLMHVNRVGGVDPEAIGPEVADVMILLLDLCSLWDIDIVRSLNDKMSINYRRSWTFDESTGIAKHVEIKHNVNKT